MLDTTLFEGRRTSSPLDVTVVGGGIAGYATAFTLQKAGHRVTVVDQNRRNISEKGGLRHVSPNAVKLLDEWGIGDVAIEGAFHCEGVDFLHRQSIIFITYE